MADTAGNNRRAPRRARPVDVASFADEIDAALVAFAQDVTYAVQMARAAVTIDRKRKVWAARRELREAEENAHAECRDHGSFDCHAYSACGTGDCKFAEGVYATLTVAAPGGTSRRPQYPHEHYSLDEAVTRLADTRSRSM